MGLMALARNLRNFDEAGVSDEAAERITARFRDAEQVARSRMFPYRWLSAYLAAPSLRWGTALEAALTASTAGVPELPGRTLVLVDTSGSMGMPMSQRSKVRHVDIGALIGVVIAARGCDVDLVGFADGQFTHALPKGGSTLREIEKFAKRTGEVGHGTRMVEALTASHRSHDRVVVVSDMQTFPYFYQGGAGRDADTVIPARVPVFGINTTGYGATAVPAGTRNRFEVGGFSDKVFAMFGLLASGQDAGWPF
jgi:hypothetical protein